MVVLYGDGKIADFGGNRHEAKCGCIFVSVLLTLICVSCQLETVYYQEFGSEIICIEIASAKNSKEFEVLKTLTDEQTEHLLRITVL